MPFLPSAAFPVDVLPNGHVRALALVTWHGYHGDTIPVPPGYITDWGTVPRLVRAVLPADGPLCRAFLVHDVLCSAHQAAHRDAYGGPPASYEERVLAATFTPRDADAVLRVILAELGDHERAAGRRAPFGTGPTRWLYWTGVRASALFAPHRRAGWFAPASCLPVLALLVPALVALAPAAIGALASCALVALGQAAAWPFEVRARRIRAAEAAAVTDAAAEDAHAAPREAPRYRFTGNTAHDPDGPDLRPLAWPEACPAPHDCPHTPTCPRDPDGWPTCQRPGWHVSSTPEEPT